MLGFYSLVTLRCSQRKERKKEEIIPKLQDEESYATLGNEIDGRLRRWSYLLCGAVAPAKARGEEASLVYALEQTRNSGGTVCRQEGNSSQIIPRGERPPLYGLPSSSNPDGGGGDPCLC